MKDIIQIKLAVNQWNRRLGEHEYTQRKIAYPGKYLGVMIKDLPTYYLKWGVLNLGNSDWANYFSRELQRRGAVK